MSVTETLRTETRTKTSVMTSMGFVDRERHNHQHRYTETIGGRWNLDVRGDRYYGGPHRAQNRRLRAKAPNSRSRVEHSFLAGGQKTSETTDECDGDSEDGDSDEDVSDDIDGFCGSRTPQSPTQVHGNNWRTMESGCARRPLLRRTSSSAKSPP